MALSICYKDIFAELESTNTLENVIFSIQLLKVLDLLEKIKTVIAIVKNAHSRRALMTLKKHFPPDTVLKLISYDFTLADGSSDFLITKDSWYKNDKVAQKIIAEYEKISIYLAKGDLAEL